MTADSASLTSSATAPAPVALPGADVPLTPADVEYGIRVIEERIGRGVHIVADLHGQYLDAKREYDTAHARAWVDAQCPQLEKKQRAVLATQRERAALDEAEAAYQYARAQMDALKESLSAYQSIAKSVAASFGAAGVGVR